MSRGNSSARIAGRVSLCQPRRCANSVPPAPIPARGNPSGRGLCRTHCTVQRLRHPRLVPSPPRRRRKPPACHHTSRMPCCHLLCRAIFPHGACLCPPSVPVKLVMLGLAFRIACDLDSLARQNHRIMEQQSALARRGARGARRKPRAFVRLKSSSCPRMHGLPSPALSRRRRAKPSAPRGLRQGWH